ncbi:hypothetical protein [Bacillus thuringiensis]|uniref:hypothetical protein n=1 Tax=Bacillus thuringiensis TaxID=1428 RepID=UPI0018CFA18D|nr:hypothetical protein [Bacillus thuringiensis]
MTNFLIKTSFYTIKQLARLASCPVKKRKRCLSNGAVVIANYNYSMNRVVNVMRK